MAGDIVRDRILPNVVALMILAAAASMSVPGADAIYGATRTDWVGKGLWLNGNLTWSGDAGRIVWGPASEAHFDTPPASGTPPSLVFTTVVEDDIYLDPSRLVQLDVHMESSGQPKCGTHGGSDGVRVTMEADGKLVAGSPGIFGNYHGGLPYQPPAGYSGCRQRMPLESAMIPSGSELKITITFLGQAGQKIAAGSDNPTPLRVPIFAEEEAYYRMPEAVPRLRTAPEGTEAITLLGLAGLSLGTIGRRRGRSVLLALALVAGVVGAGCLGSGTKGSEGGSETDGRLGADPSSTATYTVEESEGEEATGNATIVGRVQDPYGRPVSEAHAALLGTAHAATADAFGLFAFREVAPGEYRLRVDREHYDSIEVPIKAAPGKVSKVKVVLAYDESLAAAEQPHFHDYWVGEERMVVFEQPLYNMACPAGGERCFATGEFYLGPSEKDPKGLVLPGTSELEIVVDFDCRMFSKKVGLAIQDNTDPNPKNWTFFPTRGPGEPFRVRATWETTDIGHQFFSTWTFGVFGDSAAPDSCPDANVVDNAVRSISQSQGMAPPDLRVKKVTITLVRGALPLEPSHPDHWQGRDTIQVLADKPYKDPAWSVDPIFYALQATWYPICLKDEGRKQFIELEGPTHVVAVGAKSMRFFVNQSRPNGIAGATTQYRWDLYYKTGETQPEPYYDGNSVYQKAPPATLSADGKNYGWTIAVKDTEADGIYNKKSAWRFVLVADDPEMRCHETYVNGHGGLVNLQLTVDADIART